MCAFCGAEGLQDARVTLVGWGRRGSTGHQGDSHGFSGREIFSVNRVASNSNHY